MSHPVKYANFDHSGTFTHLRPNCSLQLKHYKDCTVASRQTELTYSTYHHLLYHLKQCILYPPYINVSSFPTINNLNWSVFVTETQGFCREVKPIFYMTSNLQGLIKADWSNVPTVLFRCAVTQGCEDYLKCNVNETSVLRVLIDVKNRLSKNDTGVFLFVLSVYIT